MGTGSTFIQRSKAKLEKKASLSPHPGMKNFPAQTMISPDNMYGIQRVYQFPSSI